MLPPAMALPGGSCRAVGGGGECGRIPAAVPDAPASGRRLNRPRASTITAPSARNPPRRPRRERAPERSTAPTGSASGGGVAGESTVVPNDATAEAGAVGSDDAGDASHADDDEAGDYAPCRLALSPDEAVPRATGQDLAGSGLVRACPRPQAPTARRGKRAAGCVSQSRAGSGSRIVAAGDGHERPPHRRRDRTAARRVASGRDLPRHLGRRRAAGERWRRFGRRGARDRDATRRTGRRSDPASHRRQPRGARRGRGPSGGDRRRVSRLARRAS